MSAGVWWGHSGSVGLDWVVDSQLVQPIQNTCVVACGDTAAVDGATGSAWRLKRSCGRGVILFRFGYGIVDVDTRVILITFFVTSLSLPALRLSTTYPTTVSVGQGRHAYAIGLNNSRVRVYTRHTSAIRLGSNQKVNTGK